MNGDREDRRAIRTLGLLTHKECQKVFDLR